MDPLTVEARVQANRLASRRGCTVHIYEATRQGARVLFVRAKCEGDPRPDADAIDGPAVLLEVVGRIEVAS